MECKLCLSDIVRGLGCNTSEWGRSCRSCYAFWSFLHKGTTELPQDIEDKLLPDYQLKCVYLKSGEEHHGGYCSGAEADEVYDNEEIVKYFPVTTDIMALGTPGQVLALANPLFSYYCIPEKKCDLGSGYCFMSVRHRLVSATLVAT